MLGAVGGAAGATFTPTFTPVVSGSDCTSTCTKAGSTLRAVNGGVAGQALCRTTSVVDGSAVYGARSAARTRCRPALETLRPPPKRIRRRRPPPLLACAGVELAGGYCSYTVLSGSTPRSAASFGYDHECVCTPPGLCWMPTAQCPSPSTAMAAPNACMAQCERRRPVPCPARQAGRGGVPATACCRARPTWPMRSSPLTAGSQSAMGWLKGTGSAASCLIPKRAWGAAGAKVLKVDGFGAAPYTMRQACFSSERGGGHGGQLRGGSPCTPLLRAGRAVPLSALRAWPMLHPLGRSCLSRHPPPPPLTQRRHSARPLATQAGAR